MKHLLFAAGVLCATEAVAETPVLTVYTYDSFVSDWGPGPSVEKAFEEVCSCDLQFVGAGDGAALLARLKLEGARTKADVVLGLDTSLTAQAAETGLFAEHGQSPVVDVPNPFGEPGTWSDQHFLPYDWGFLAFVHDKTKLAEPPKSFEELAASETKIVIQDPRSSTPGLGLMLWVKALYGDKAGDMWGALADNIVTVTPGWSEAYGLFLEGEADMVLSYTTSPDYHRIAEEDDSKAAALFDRHYMQIEVAGKLAGTDQPELADRFLQFMLSDAFQGIIPTTNWMYPAVTPSTGMPEGFASPLGQEQAVLLPPEDVPGMRDQALAEWRAALSQ
ncbi:thiamine ABC transporter substrate binding subunit [Alisedimentitalea sp. MJ-SS2]|uniref:thiamine ABC transporter substrate binding subunit n=1 Tax=Aliisedimentitalea sp. MJ-SS2 TaxID=3049795 RepID=UPI00290B15CD|nr:thiamine ABC transporter substrate binding subunit [Alisedimentitalea sp. MJ-SS2]MDU8927707.1 thiamine ABC transporter substrate binding subunit [Alisedimentitalea sp. MJ-SS2]